jgi:hypothetical protein
MSLLAACEEEERSAKEIKSAFAVHADPPLRAGEKNDT